MADMTGTSPAVAVSQVSHSYDTGVAIADVEFRVREGEFLCIVGPSGCGKTTVLNALAGEVRPRVGSISVFGEPPRLGRADIAYMYARDALLPWRSVVRNVELGLEARAVPRDQRRVAAKDMIGRVGLEKFADARPRQLSQGMRQRAALARTFVLRPRLLLMDEPFAAVDAQTRLDLQALLLGLWEEHQMTVMFVTHDLREAVLLGDRVLVMAGTPGRLMKEVRVDFARPREPRSVMRSTEFEVLYEEIGSGLEGIRVG